MTRANSRTMGTSSSSVQCSRTPLLQRTSTARFFQGSGRVRSHRVIPGAGSPETENSSRALVRIGSLKSASSMRRPDVASSAEILAAPHPVSSSVSLERSPPAAPALSPIPTAHGAEFLCIQRSPFAGVVGALGLPRPRGADNPRRTRRSVRSTRASPPVTYWSGVRAIGGKHHAARHPTTESARHGRTGNRR